MRTRTALNAATTEALAEVKAYRGSPVFVSLINLLDAIGDQHLETLVDAALTEVPKVQGALGQTRSLRRALMGENHSPVGN